MRTGALLCSQPVEGIEPLGAFNQPAYHRYGQIRAALLNDLGMPFADYFARPETETDGTRIGWLAHELGEPRRWADMTVEEQARLDPARQRILEGFTKYRRGLDSAPINSPRNNFGKLLAQACCVPGPEYLYFVGEQPIVAFWGFKTLAAAAGIDPLHLVPGTMVLAATEALATDTIPIVAKRRSRWAWLWWLLGLLLLLLLLLWLYAWWFRVEVPFGAWVGLPYRQANFLPGRYDRFTIPDDIPERNDGGIVPVGPGGATVPATRPDGPGGVVDHAPLPSGVPSADKSGLPAANKPDGQPDKPLLPADAAKTPPPPAGDKAPIPADLPRLPPMGTQPQRGPQLTMPNIAKVGPADFMQGVWRSRGGLMVNGSPAEEYYRFDKNGQGDVTLRTRDGHTQCSAPAHASVGADLTLSVAENPALKCQDGTSLPGAVTQCSGSADQTKCAGTNQSDGSHFSVQMESVQKQ